ncbi:MAG: IS1182 family transposase [Deltaproteobacteria bacterium]|nr:IS1182 family transposase [Deltaproteobacteria bacterium]
MRIAFKKDPAEHNQRVLFPTNVFDLLPEDHDCFVYEEIFKQLKTSKVEQHYSVRGQNAYHPRLVTGILIYAYSQGVFSSRQIEKKCREDLGFMYISHRNCPNFRVLSDFRKDNQEFFKESFKQSVLIAREAGMVSLGHVSTDGSKFKADTSKHKAMSYGRLRAKEKELTEEIEALLARAGECDEQEDEELQDNSGYELPEELRIKEKRLEKIKAAREALEKREAEQNPGKKIEDKKQISFADKEARIMGKKGEFQYAYNGQISVDSDHQIIVGQHLSQNANDKKELKPALEEIKEVTGEHPEKMSIDNGYMSGENLQCLSETEIDAYMATGKGEGEEKTELENSNGTMKASHFTYNSEEDAFVCPAGNVLPLKSQTYEGKKIYQADKNDCDKCKDHSRCCGSENGKPRTIHSDDKEPLRQAMREKMRLDSSHQVYKERKVIVEPVFGQIKNSGFQGFSMRGHRKTSGEFSLVCAVHNFKKIVKAVFRGVVRLEYGKLAPATG